MWLKRKPKNRRFERQNVLEVKLSASQTRARRLRLTTWLLALTFGSVFGVYVCWRVGESALNRFVFENQAFAVQQIDLQTDGVIPVEQLLRWAGVRKGDNLFALDLARVKRDLERVPQIESAAVERVLPQSLKVRVTEREPVAQVHLPRPQPRGGACEPMVFLLDAAGCVMVPMDFGGYRAPSNDGLPLITGLNPAELRPGRQLDAPQLRAALQLLAAFDLSPMAGLVDVRRVDLSSPEVLQVTTGQGNEVTFTVDQMDRQLRRWRSVHDFGQRAGKAVKALDLSVTNNIPVDWQEAGVVPPAPVKGVKTTRSKKKHV